MRILTDSEWDQNVKSVVKMGLAKFAKTWAAFGYDRLKDDSKSDELYQIWVDDHSKGFFRYVNIYEVTNGKEPVCFKHVLHAHLTNLRVICR